MHIIERGLVITTCPVIIFLRNLYSNVLGNETIKVESNYVMM